MKKLSNIFIKYKIPEIFFYLGLALTPLNDALFVISFGVFLFTGLITSYKNLSKNYYPLIITLLFIVSLISLTYTQDLDATYHKLFKNLALLLVPVGLYLNNIDKVSLKRGKLVFLVSWVLFSVFSLLKLLYSWLYFPEERNYYNFIQDSMYHNHLPHDAMYLCTALIFLLFSFKTVNRYLQIFISILFFSILVLFGVRLGILLYILVITYFLYVNRKKLLNLKSVVIMMTVIIFSAILVSSNNYTKDKFYSTLQSVNINFGEDKMTEIANDYHRINFRFKIWPLAIDIIKDKPIFGYGAGTEQELLYDLAQKRDLNILKGHAHNQFLSITIQYGILGLVILLIVLSSILKKAIRNKEFSLIFVILFCSMLTHSYMHMQQGIFYFVIFGSIILKFGHHKLGSHN